MVSRPLMIVLAAFAACGASVSFPTPALAYASEADCESFEGKGKCSACVLGPGDGGWHRSGACPSTGSAAINNLIGILIQPAIDAEEISTTRALNLARRLQDRFGRNPGGAPN